MASSSNLVNSLLSADLTMNDVVAELAKKHPNILALNVEAEEQADIAESFEIEAVPSFVVLRGHTLLARIAGADAPHLLKLLRLMRSVRTYAPKSHTDAAPPVAQNGGAAETPEELDARLRRLMTQSKPRCGFSRKISTLLKEQGVEFSSFDILQDEDVRQGLKKLNDWPTFPQLIVNGELVGGLDIVQEMVETGEFADVFAAA
ncbi:thioredoxin-like protein [Mycena galopus ATCC 62051]|nr:thioredoxin-like protein [Mycena galopus ATCC 62051]